MDKISALMDGELDDRQAREQLVRLKQDDELVDCWHTFHVIGDSLRGEPLLSQGFSGRVTDRLAGEPTVLAPRRGAVRRITTYALSAAASVSAVALVGWMAFVNNPLAPQPEVAKAPASINPAPAATPSTQLASVPSDGKMNEYLIAHQEFSPSTSIQGVAPYIRTVSGSQQDKGR
jgi:sigma-E factor negative regulatory protein RseA